MTKNTMTTLDVKLPVKLFKEHTFPLPYTELGQCDYDGRETRAGIPINFACLYFFIDRQLASIAMEDLINLVMPQLIAMPARDGYIVAATKEAA